MIQHLAPHAVQAWRPLPLSLVVPGDRAVLHADVYYRTQGAPAFTALPLRETAGAWSAVIPAAQVEPPALEYYLRVQARDGSVSTRPATDPARAPLVVVVVPEADSTISILSPTPDEEADVPTPQIAAFFDPPLPPAAVCTVWLDGSIVAAQTDSARDYVSYVPESPLAPGEHVARIEISGDAAPRAQAWTFRVPGDGSAGTGPLATSGRLALGAESASGRGYSSAVLASLPQPPGTYISASGDVSATRGDESITGWYSSTPSTRPRTQGALLLTGRGHEAEAGSLLLWESELALSGPQATGARAALRSRRGDVRAFAVHIDADEVGNRSIDGGAATLLGHLAPGADVAVLATYGAESATDAVDFALGDARRGWTVAPRASLERAGWQGLAEWSLSAWDTRPGASRDSSATAHAVLLSAIRSAGLLRASVRFGEVGAGYHAMLAPFTQEGRREASATATLSRDGWSATGGYFVSRFTFADGDSTPAWSHRTDLSLSRLDTRGRGATLSYGTQDRSWFVSLSGAVATGGVRASLAFTRSHVLDITSWSGSGSLHAAVGARLTLDATASAALTQESAGGLPSETLSRSVLPRLQGNWRIDARNAVEGALSTSSYSISLYPADLGGARELRTYDQTVARLSYVRSW